ncbi:MAG: hypothetical protein RLW61_21380 [Gammaproteobacteria bacterium]
MIAKPSTSCAQSRPAALAGRARALLTLLAGLEVTVGAWALQATVIHRAAYPEAWQYVLDLTWPTLLVLTGLGLLRCRRWAALLTSALLYLAFFAVLAALSLLYAPGRWWYWLLPPALPALGYAIHVLRRERAHFPAGW